MFYGNLNPCSYSTILAIGFSFTFTFFVFFILFMFSVLVRYAMRLKSHAGPGASQEDKQLAVLW